MRLTRFASLFVVLALIALPTFAADRTFELTGWASWIDPNSSGTFNSANPNQAFNIDFKGKSGYGVSANLFWGGSISTEFSAYEARPDAQFGFPGGVTNNKSSLRMIPLSAVLQWHLAPHSAIDPYIGAGGTYVLFDDLENPSDLGSLGVDRIHFKDDVGFCANAGIGFAITPNFAITIDGKYVPVKSSATAVFASGPNSGARVKINPVIASAGLTLRF